MRWVPNLVESTSIWQLVADLNRPALMDGALLTPSVTGPATMPTTVFWDVHTLTPLPVSGLSSAADAAFMPVAPAHALDADALERARRKLFEAVERTRTEFLRPGSPFARFATAFTLPSFDTPDAYFLDVGSATLKIACWGARPRDTGAAQLIVYDLAQFLSQRDSGPSVTTRGGAAAGTDSTRADASLVSRGMPCWGARVALRVLFVSALLVALLFAYQAWRTWHARDAASAVGSPRAAPHAPSNAPDTSFAMRDEDRDGVADEVDRCPKLAAPAPDGCPHEDGVELAQDRVLLREKVYFAPGVARLEASSAAPLDALARLLGKIPDIEELRIDGYADATGDRDKNFVLSTARALAVRQALIDRGVDASRLRVDAHGSDQARDGSAQEEDRRVSFVITRVRHVR